MFPKYTKKVANFGLEVVTGKDLSFWLEFIDKTGENVFCLQIQIKLKSCVTLFSWLVHNKLKTKFNNLFHSMVLNTKKIHNSFRRNFPTRAKQMQEKATAAAVRSLRAKIVIVGNSIWVENHHFLLNYLTVLVYTKTIVHLSVGG